MEIPISSFASGYESSSRVRKVLVAKETKGCVRTPDHISTDDVGCWNFDGKLAKYRVLTLESPDTSRHLSRISVRCENVYNTNGRNGIPIPDDILFGKVAEIAVMVNNPNIDPMFWVT